MERSIGSDCRSEEHTSELQSRPHLVCRLLLEKKNKYTFVMIMDTAPTEIYTLSLHDALPIWYQKPGERVGSTLVVGPRQTQRTTVHHRPSSKSRASANWVLQGARQASWRGLLVAIVDRKSTRLNSSHDRISYAVFCLKKKINIRLL